MAVPALVTTNGFFKGQGFNRDLDPSGTTIAGELLVIIMTAEGSGNVTTTPSGWTLGLRLNSVGMSFAVYWKIAAGGEGATNVVVSGSSTKYAGFYLRISGHRPVDPIHLTASQNFTASTSHGITGVTTTLKDCLALYVLAKQDGSSEPLSISGTGWSEAREDAFTVTPPDGIASAVGSKSVAATGETGTATVGSATSSVASGGQIAIVRGLGAANVNGVVPASINGRSLGQFQFNSVDL